MVVWSLQARSDLKAIFDYIARDSAHYARKVVQEIAAKPDMLERHPRLGRMVPELSDENVRQLLIYSYRIIYEIVDEDIVILTIVHQRRDFAPDDIERA